MGQQKSEGWSGRNREGCGEERKTDRQAGRKGVGAGQRGTGQMINGLSLTLQKISETKVDY